MFPKPRREIMEMFLQNGVANGLHRDGSSPQIPVGASVDSATGNLALCNSSKRPNELGMGSLKGYFEKGFHDRSHSDDFGSLPSTPEAEIDGETEDVLESDTRQLLGRFLSDFTGLTKPRWAESKELSTMKRVVEDLLTRHRIAYNGKYSPLLRGFSAHSSLAASVAASPTRKYLVSVYSTQTDSVFRTAALASSHFTLQLTRKL